MPTTQPATQPAVDAWQRLSSPDFAEREQATDELWRQGEAIRPRLLAEADVGSPDRQDRVARLLRLLDLGLTPDLPSQLVDIVLGYNPAAPSSEKRRRLSTAFAIDGSAPVLLRLGTTEPEASIRQLIFDRAGLDEVAIHARRLIDSDPAALRAFADAYDDVSSITGGTLTLGLVLAEQDNRLDAEARAAADKARRRPADTQKLARQLFALDRRAEALKVADEQAAGTRLADLDEKFRVLMADWPGLIGGTEASNRKQARAVCLLLTGDAAGARTAITEWAANFGISNTTTRRLAGRGLLLAGCVPEGIDALAKAGEIGVLRAQGRWDEALRLPLPTDVTVEGSTLRARLEGERDAVKRDAGLLPPVDAGGREKTPGPLEQALGDAADTYRQGDAAAALDRLTRAFGRADRAERPVPRKAAAKRAALPRRTTADAVNPANALAIGVDAAASRLAALCLDKLNRPQDAAAERRRADLLCATGNLVWVTQIERLDLVGLADLADAEAARMERFCPDDDWAMATLTERSARRLTQAGDFAAAARARDRLLVLHAMGQVGYVETVGYLRGPYLRHTAHARAALAANDPARAVDHLKRAAEYLPIAAGLELEFVPKLRAAGQEKAADELFETLWAKQTGLCRAYPKSSSIRNSTAWTALRCDRHLDVALTLSQESVALQPNEPAYLDTYAEALFRAGRKDEALATIRRAHALLPDDPVMNQRLEGFEQGRIVVPDEPE